MRRKRSGGAVERARAKIGEARFFLAAMEERTTLGKAKEFGYCISAFLSAVKSIEYQLPDAEKKALRAAEPEIAFLMEQRNLEVHEVGVKIIFTVDSIRVGRFHSRFHPQVHRFHQPRLPSWAQAVSGVRSWHFTERRSEDLVSYCTGCLDRIERFVESRVLATTT